MKHGFFAKHALTAALLVFSAAWTGKAEAQCLVNSLIVTTGTDNNGTPVPQGSNDPHWFCVNKTGVYTNSAPPAPANALVVTPVIGSWAGGGNWLCDNQSNVTPGQVTTSVSTLTFQREFRLCSDDEVTFELHLRADGLIADILVDNVSTGLFQTTGNWQTNSLIWSPAPFTQFLSAGTHTLTIVVSNPSPQTHNDPIGFFLNGNVTSFNNSIVNDQDPQCAGFACAPRCNEECYWTVDGNNIINGRNIFGTLTNDDIRIVSNGNATPDRGVISGGNALTGGYLGWNTTAPTARVHVDCKNGNNPASQLNQLSDVRFENLEPGGGYILAIDAQGYVYNTWMRIDGHEPHPDGTAATYEDMMSMKQELRELKMQLADLYRSIAAGTGAAAGNMLYQNTPNPFNATTTIRYHVAAMQQSAFIVLYDLNGRELTKYAVQPGEGTISISANSMQPGTYLYSLFVDGREVETKKMVLLR